MYGMKVNTKVGANKVFTPIRPLNFEINIMDREIKQGKQLPKKPPISYRKFTPNTS